MKEVFYERYRAGRYQMFQRRGIVHNTAPHRASTAKTAFTLIELAIVLVVIGLLIAGIVAGRSLVEAAKFRKTIQDITAYKVAFLTFRAQYDQLPGDFSDAFTYWGTACADSSANCNGNGDRIINPHVRENTPSFQHLSMAKLVPNTFPQITNIWSVDATNSPVGQWPSSFYTFMSTQVIGSGWSEKPNTGIWFGSGGVGWPYGTPLKPLEAQKIDAKIDDGLPDSGAVLGNASWDRATGNCYSGNAYSITYAAPACLLFFGQF